MYFNENKENTNIDAEFKDQKQFNSFNFSDYKKPLIIAGIVILFIIAIIIIIALAKGKKTYFIVLNGDENITIYEGATYNEPGYSAFDNKRHDLSSQVIVKDNLDSDNIGTYTIIYSLNSKSVTRTINVIKKPEVTTMLYIMGNKNMTLKVGDTFEDPGYKAIDAIDGDLTDKVTQNGEVNTQEKGTYKIVYSVVNSEGVTVSETRIVTVE